MINHYFYFAYQGSIVAVVHDVLTQGEHIAELRAHRVLQMFGLEQKKFKNIISYALL